MSKLHKRRIDALEPVAIAMNPQCFDWLCKELWYLKLNPEPETKLQSKPAVLQPAVCTQINTIYYARSATD